MNGGFSLILKGQLSPKVLVFEVMLTEKYLKQGFPVASVIVNANDSNNIKVIATGHSCLQNMLQSVKREAVETTQNILSILE